MKKTAVGMKKVVGTEEQAATCRADSAPTDTNLWRLRADGAKGPMRGSMTKAPRALTMSMAEMATAAINVHDADGTIGMMRTIACYTAGHSMAKGHVTIVGRDASRVMIVVKCTVLIVASCSGAVCPVRSGAEMLPVLGLVRMTSMRIAGCQLIRVVSTGIP